MSYDLIIDPDTEDEEAYSLASSRGWFEFCNWALELPKGAHRNLFALCNDGEADHLDDVAQQIVRGLETSPPQVEGVADTARHLVELFEGRGPDQVAIVTN